MKLEKEPSPSKGNKKKANRIILKARAGLLVLFVTVGLYGYFTYNLVQKQETYDNLNISFFDTKNIEYGTANYNVLDLVENVYGGSIIKYTKNLDTSKVGTQEVVFEISKDDIVKEVKLNVEIKDTNAPEITFKKNEISIYKGDNFDIKSNIEKVADIIDGDISLSNDETTAHYTVSSDFDANKAGKYTVTVTAYDNNGNSSDASYKINVNEKPQPQSNPAVVYTNRAASVDTSSVVAAAQSLLGTRYVSGGTNPNVGFDCSGFVKYVYSLFGVSLSGGSSSQLHAGAAVNEGSMQAGDIIIWANNGSSSASHSSIYAGDGTIIHATSNRGVQKTNLNSWKNWGQHIIGVRRV